MRLPSKQAVETIERMYDIPKEQNIPLSKVQARGFIMSQMAIKMIHQGNLRAIRVGRKFFLPRIELIRYLADQLGLDNPDCQSDTIEAEIA